MNASGPAVGVGLGSGLMVTSVVVTLIDACESTEETRASVRKVESRILNFRKCSNV